jgi:hypothetical protein
MPSDYTQPCTIHPATIDSSIQPGFAAIFDLHGKVVLNDLLVGKFVKEVWVSAENDFRRMDSVRSHARLCHEQNGSFEMETHTWDTVTDKGLMSMTGVLVSALKKRDVGTSKNRQSSYILDWKPDGVLLTNGSSKINPDVSITNHDSCSVTDSVAVEAVHPKNAGCTKLALIHPHKDAQTIHSRIDLKQAIIQEADDADIIECELQDLGDVDLIGRLCVFLLEMTHPALPNILRYNFVNLRNTLNSCEKLLWVTGDPVTEPQFNTIAGLIRTIRWERDMDSKDLVTLVTLAIMDNDTTASQLGRAISAIVSCQYLQCSHILRNEEYRLQSGILHVSRLAGCGEADNFLSSRFTDPDLEMVAWKDICHSAVLHNSTPGLLHNMHWETDTYSDSTINAGEVEIQVTAAGLNFKDVLTAMGEIAETGLGQEGAGDYPGWGKGRRPEAR